MTFSALGIVILAALGFWVLGSLALRFGGALLVLVGAVGLATSGEANGLLPVALGAVLWWVGHFHFALRRGAWKSELAGYVFEGSLAAWHRRGGRREDPAAPAGADKSIRHSM